MNMTELFNLSIDIVQHKLGSIKIHPALNDIVGIISSPSSNSDLSPSQLSKQAVELLIITQPIIVIQRGREYLCISGLRTLHAARVTFISTDNISVQAIQNPEVTSEQLIWIAYSDIYLKTFINMYLHEPSLLLKLYNQMGKELIESIAPKHQSKKQFAKDAGYSRQRVFYEK